MVSTASRRGAYHYISLSSFSLIFTKVFAVVTVVMVVCGDGGGQTITETLKVALWAPQWLRFGYRYRWNLERTRGMLRYFSFDTWDRRSFAVHLWSLDLFTLMVKELVDAMLLSLAAESGEAKLKPPQGALKVLSCSSMVDYAQLYLN